MALSEAEGLLRMLQLTSRQPWHPAIRPCFEKVPGASGCSSSVEKALKAWLLHLGEEELPLTHDLRRLLRLLAARGALASE